MESDGRLRFLYCDSTLISFSSIHFCFTLASHILMTSITFSPLSHTHTHTYVHMHRWPSVEYVNRHLLQYPIFSPHHVSDMLMQPTQFFPSTSSPPFTFPLLPLLSADIPEACQQQQMRERRGESVERGERGFKQNLIMILLWMDVTHTNRHVSSSEKPGLLENNSGKSRRGIPSVGGRTKLSPLALSVLLPFCYRPSRHRLHLQHIYRNELRGHQPAVTFNSAAAAFLQQCAWFALK